MDKNNNNTKQNNVNPVARTNSITGTHPVAKNSVTATQSVVSNGVTGTHPVARNSVTGANPAIRSTSAGTRRPTASQPQVSQQPRRSAPQSSSSNPANSASAGRVKRPLTPEQRKRLVAEQRRKTQIWQMNEFMGLVLCGIMMLILVVVGIIAIVAPKAGYSTLEKRKLAEMPEISLENISDGSFSEGVDLFFADNFPWREGFISQSKSIRRFFGIRPEGKTIYSPDGADDESGDENVGLSTNADDIDRLLSELKNNSGTETNAPSNDIPETTVGVTDTPTIPDENKDVPVPEVSTPQNGTTNTADTKGERRGVLYVMGDTALELFNGKNEHAEYYSQVVNLHAETYKKYVPDIKVYCMVFPTHTEFALPDADKNLSKDQRLCIDSLKEALGEDVTFVDPYSELEAAFNRGEYMYFRTDHHWTARGAYYAFDKFATAAGLEHKSLNEYSGGKIAQFLGSFYASTTDPALKANPDYVEYFNIDTPYKATYYKRDKSVYSEDETLLYRGISDINNGYLCFTGGDQPYIKIITENKNGRKLLIFKESYGNPLVTFLTDCYEEIHVADIRSFPYNSALFVSENGITDVLFTNSIMSASTTDRIKDIEKLLTKK